MLDLNRIFFSPKQTWLSYYVLVQRLESWSTSSFPEILQYAGIHWRASQVLCKTCRSAFTRQGSVSLQWLRGLRMPQLTIIFRVLGHRGSSVCTSAVRFIKYFASQNINCWNVPPPSPLPHPQHPTPHPMKLGENVCIFVATVFIAGWSVTGQMILPVNPSGVLWTQKLSPRHPYPLRTEYYQSFSL